MYSAAFREVFDAISWEKRLKRWNRKKKEALIAGEYEKLPILSQRKTPFQKKKRCHPEEPRPSSFETLGTSCLAPQDDTAGRLEGWHCS